VLDMFAAEGLEVPSLLRDCGFDATGLDRPDARFPADDISQLWQLAVARSGKATLGLSRELAARHGNLDMLGHAMTCSPDLHAGLERLARYLAVVSDAATFELEAEARGQWLLLGHVGSRRPVPRQRVEYGMLTMLVLCGWLTRRELRPLAVEFVYPAPPDDAGHRAAFGCAIRFGAAANRLLLAEADMRAAIPSRHPALAALHERLLDEQLTTLADSTLSRRVCAEITRRLPGGEPRRQDVAAGLGVTERTLQRRLQAESTSYQALLDLTRRELAQQYLADRRNTLTEVADLLGFVDSSNFFRACKRWFGVPPAQYRTQLRDSGEVPGTTAPAAL
jgi:AraC-like DNA-binding protein